MSKYLLQFKNLEKSTIIIYSLLLILLLSDSYFAQGVTIQLQAPPPYQMRIEDMWNLVVVNRDKEKQIYLHGIATEQSTGLIVDVTSSIFTIPSGVKRIKAADVGTITVNQKNSTYQTVINRLSALPNGTYEICVEVIDASTNIILGTSCIEHEVLNLSQVTLLYPEDNSILNHLDEEETGDTSFSNQRGIEKKDIRRGMVIAKPGSITPHKRLASSSIVFSWLPPTPLPNNFSVKYRIKIVELFAQQSAYDAMQSNPLFFSASGIVTTSFQYPISARDFSTDRTYAWQIDAYAGETLIASSEIYTFSFQPTSATRRTLNDSKRSSLNIIRASNTVIEDLPGGLNSLAENNLVSSSLSFKDNSFNQKTNLLSIPNMLGSLLSDGESKAISFAFDGELFGETSNRRGSGSDRKPSFGYLQLSPSLSFYGIPFGLNVMLSSENSSGRQNINSLSFLYSVDAAREVIQNKIETEGEENVPGLMKFFSNFHSFGIGTNYPSYTPLTMQGVPVSGLSFEFNPGWFYLATALQKNQKPIDYVSFRRDLYAGRIGVGQKDDSHLYFTGMYTKDLSSSIRLDSLNRILTPNTNYVFGIESKLTMFEDKVSLDGEIAAAMLTRDNRDPELVNEDIPQFVRNVFQPKVSSQVDYAYSLKTTFNNSESNTKVIAGVKMIGPGYRTLGNPTLRNDKFEVEGKIDQKFLQRQISVIASMRYYRDNLINSKLFTTTTLAPGIQLGLKFKDYPYITLSYNPNFLSNDASDPAKKIDFKNHLATVSTGYNFKINDMTLGSNLFYLFNKSKSLDSLSGYTLNSFTVSENLLFKFPLVLSASFGMNFLKFADYSGQVTNLDGSVGYTFFEQWSNTVGLNYSIEKDKSNRLGFYLNSSYSVSENVIIDLRVEKNNYTDKLLNTNDFNEILARSTIRLKF